MNNTRKIQQIEYIRNMTGWVYSELPWFSEKDAQRASRQRDKLLQELSGWIKYGCEGSKLYSGSISPGCLICGQGGWICNFINGLCTRNCFFCPQNRQIKKERDPLADGLILNKPLDQVNFIKLFRAKGVGFSGGEPLLVLDRLLSYIQAIRKEFGSALYLWMYTNGDLVSRPVLRKLSAAGLDEIRFNLSARKYDLAPAILAKEYISTVTVEIPAIPEDFKRVKDLIVEMEQEGIDFLNLHELHANEHNYRSLCQRKYHFLHSPNTPIFESEICALKLLIFARKQAIQLPINYCSSVYKERFHASNYRKRLNRLRLKSFEEITGAGYIRLLQVKDSLNQIKKMIRHFNKIGCPAGLWEIDQDERGIAIHSDMLDHLDWSSAKVAISYLNVEIGQRNPTDGMAEENLVYKKSVIYTSDNLSQILIKSWKKIYLEKNDAKDVLASLYRDYLVEKNDDFGKLSNGSRELKKVSVWEELESGLPQIF